MESTVTTLPDNDDCFLIAPATIHALTYGPGGCAVQSVPNAWSFQAYALGDCQGLPRRRVRRVTAKLLAPRPDRPCLCGRCLPEETGKPGRPAEYCGRTLGRFTLKPGSRTEKVWTPESALPEGMSGTDACRELAAALSVVEKYATVVAADATQRGWLDVRARLFAVANIRTWNKGLKLQARALPEAK
jgi:hypothetical protein